MARPHKLLRDARGRIDLKCLDRDGLTEFMAELGEPADRALRVYKWIWQKGARTFAEMEGVAGATRRKLDEVAYLSFLEPALVLRSVDGTVKYLWKLEDGYTIESVLIPDGDRVTLCMSSQVGCAMACTFCLTGDLGLKRHLKVSEIANQALQVGLQADRITNIVMMGMGEPLHNLDALCDALRICLDDHARNFSHRRITVSTVGLVPQMRELAERLPVNLAVSLNSTTEEHRRQIMPITKKYSMAELLQACREVPLPSGKRIAFEYVMFEGENDTLEHADQLLELLSDVPAKVNLIPYNVNPERDIGRPGYARVKAFQHHLVTNGMSTTIRTTRGTDISAACGQLGKAWEQAADRGWLEEARRLAGVS
jgi:23S rRNA (adenine2503-C2)-methyltransferase